MTEDAAAGAARPSRPVVLGASADGGTASAARADFPEPRPRRRIPRRTLVAALAALLLLLGPAVGTNAILNAPPAAFAVFDSPASAADTLAQATLESLGAAMVGEARVLAPEVNGFTLVGVRAPEGTGQAVRTSGGFPTRAAPIPSTPERGSETPAPAPEPAVTEVCLWLVQSEGRVRGQCATDERFVRQGVAVSVPDQTVETIAHWAPDGSTSLEHVPYGPTTLEALRALEIPAIQNIDRPADDRDSTVDGAAANFLFGGEEVLPPRQIAVEDRWQMVAGIYRPASIGGLLACVTVLRVDDPGQESGGGCTDISTFASWGTTGMLGFNSTNVTWSWTPAGETTLTVEEQ